MTHSQNWLKNINDKGPVDWKLSPSVEEFGFMHKEKVIFHNDYGYLVEEKKLLVEAESTEELALETLGWLARCHSTHLRGCHRFVHSRSTKGLMLKFTTSQHRNEKTKLGAMLLSRFEAWQPEIIATIRGVSESHIADWFENVIAKQGQHMAAKAGLPYFSISIPNFKHLNRPVSLL